MSSVLALPVSFRGTRAPQLRLIRFALLSSSLAAGVVVWISWYGGGTPSDAWCFYNPSYGRQDFSYIWTPAFAQLTAPLRLLPFDVFVGIIRGLEIAAVVALAPYAAWIALLLPPVAAEINAANINMLLILGIATSFKYPAAWTLPLLTKPSSALALLWFAARRDWRKVFLAVVPAFLLSAASIALDPGYWGEYLNALLFQYPDTPGWPFPIPVWPRIPLAIAIAILGRNHRWALPVAAIVAMPRLYFQTPAMLLGVIPTMKRTFRVVHVSPDSAAAGAFAIESSEGGRAADGVSRDHKPKILVGS